MPLDPAIIERLRAALAGTPGLTDKRLFGGHGFLVNGRLAVAAHSDGGVLVRCAKEDHAAFAALPGAQAMEKRGRVAVGWVVVAPEAVATDAALAAWAERGRAFAASQPPK